MSLSEQEQRALREIEQSLLADDPKFGSSVSADGVFGGARSGGLSIQGIAIGLVGLVLLIGGVALAAQSIWFISLSVLGFLVMFGAGVWMLRGGGQSSAKEQAAASRRKPKAAGRSAGSSSLGDRMEENFRKRFEGQ